MTIPVNELADHLAAAEEERRTVPQLVHEHPDLDLDTAYDIQTTRFDQRLAAGDRLVGYKVGLSSRAKQVAMGVHEPIYGRLSRAMWHPEEEPLDLSTLVHPIVEAEIAFLLGDDLDGDDATVASVLAATEGLLPALEILDSRYDNFKFTMPDAIADNASAARVVLGGRLIPPDRVDAQLEGMVLRADGQVVHTAAGAAVSGHPALSVAWLAQKVGGLKAGDVVISGGLTAAVPLRERRVVSAEYTNLGRIVLTIA